jgi:hypothetical protein
MLWLHAYRYTIPEFEGGPLKVKTEKPVWAKEGYQIASQSLKKQKV